MVARPNQASFAITELRPDKNDKIDSRKIAALIRGGNFPLAYAYPKRMRSTRDLLRRRMHLMRKRAELLAHIQNTNTQYKLDEIGRKIAYKADRAGVAERFEDPSKSIQVDLTMIDTYDKLLHDLELHILKHAKAHDANTSLRGGTANHPRRGKDPGPGHAV